MAKDLGNEFKTLLSRSEYLKLTEIFKEKIGNLQINYYFDTPRFTLKASEIGLRVRKRDSYEITLKRKKGYVVHEIKEKITEEQFINFVEKHIIPCDNIAKEVSDVIKDQKLYNYMSLSTYRIGFPYKSGVLSIDKCEYVDTKDYELLFNSSDHEQGKREFVELVNELGIKYKKCDSKIKRAYAALRKKL